MRAPGWWPDKARAPLGFGRRKPGGGGPASSAVTAPRSVDLLLDERLLARLRLLTIQPGRTPVTGLAGEHRSRARGASPEFVDFKHYTPGDDFRRIDWNSYARLDGLFVRESEATTELDVHLLLDASNSMNWRSDPRGLTKFRFAAAVAAALGYTTLWHFDRLTVTASNDPGQSGFGPARGRAHALALLQRLSALQPGGDGAVAPVLQRYIHQRARPGLLFIVSDLLGDDPAVLGEVLRSARARGWTLTVLHTLDPAERSADAAVGYLIDENAPDELLVELTDLESGEMVTTAPNAGVLQHYRAAIDEWLRGCETACADNGARYLSLVSDQPLTAAIDRMRERGVLG